MSVVAVFLEHEQGKISKGSLCALAAAQQYAAATGLGGVVGCLLGTGARSAADLAARYGCTRVLYSEESALDSGIAAVLAAALTQQVAAAGASAIFAAASSVGKDCMPRVAVALNAGQASDIVGIHPNGSFRRPVFAGDILADVEILTPVKVVTVRTSAFSPAAQREGAGVPIDGVALSNLPVGMGEVVSREESGGDRPELGDAEIVVSGGRALGSSENFEKVIFPLADALGAAVGASRAAVDSGYAPNDWQVGQTGKIVAPQLYVAVGISGAIQHLAGMKDSKVIVAINKDPDAPIYEVANYGLTADLFQAVPELTEAVKRVKQG